MSATNGVVEAFDTIKTGKNEGKPKVRISGIWYTANFCDITDMKQGDHVSFEWSAYGPNKDIRGLKAWSKTPTGNGAVVTGNVSSRPSTPREASGESAPISGSYGPAFPPELLPSVSNVVAHAITSGLIRSPQDLGPWVIAWRWAFEGKRAPATPPAAQEEPPPYTEKDVPFDDRVPF